jgi:hypothetical protein
MRRYSYERLEVTGNPSVFFDPKAPNALEKAVEYLEEAGAGRMVWLRAMAAIKAKGDTWETNALLTWDEVRGRTADEIWQMLDEHTENNLDAVVRSRIRYM